MWTVPVGPHPYLNMPTAGTEEADHPGSYRDRGQDTQTAHFPNVLSLTVLLKNTKGRTWKGNYPYTRPRGGGNDKNWSKAGRSCTHHYENVLFAEAFVTYKGMCWMELLNLGSLHTSDTYLDIF